MRIYIILFLTAVLAANGFSAVELKQAQIFGTDDLHLNGLTMSSYQPTTGEHILSFTDGFELLIGDNRLKSTDSVVWLKSEVAEYRGIVNVNYKVTVYLQGKVSVDKGKGSMTSGLDLAETKVAGMESMVVEFDVAGEVFATADKRVVQDIRTSQLYRNALVATGQVKLIETQKTAIASAGAKGAKGKGYSAPRKAPTPGLIGRIFGGGKTEQAEQPQEPVVAAAPPPKFQYPVNISSLGSEKVQYSKETLADGSIFDVIQNRFYLWQKQDEDGGLLEFQADNAVIFYTRGADSQPGDSNNPFAGSTVKAIYFCGDIIMTEGQRTIRADEVYYDFQTKQALAVNAVMRNYDPARGIPIYVKAKKLRQVAENKFAAKDVVVTSSEFYVPRLVMTASEIVITDRTNVDAQAGKLGDDSYYADMKNIRLKLENRTMFYWPRYRGGLRRPDIPIRRLSVGHDSDFGTMVETEWYLARMLGLREPKGVDSTFIYDYYSARGMGTGARLSYKKEDYFGNIDGYIINDKGKDDLSRGRRNIEPPHELRGRFKLQHRQFMPYNWQLSLETTYISDENYMESLHRNEFMAGLEQETYIHLKRIQDNWGFAILGKWRINDFADQFEELPSAQYHLKAQSLFNDKITLYHDTTVGMLRQRIGDKHVLAVSQSKYLFGSSRSELDMPLQLGNSKVVPFIAGTIGHDDRSGFNRGAVTGTSTAFGSKEVFIGEIGTRASTQFWKVFENIKSELWDVNGLRHIVKPYANVSLFGESDSTINQRDIFNLGILQRLQTKRGVGDKQRIVDWMRFNVDFTWVSNDSSTLVRPDKTIWNNPFVPLATLSAPDIFNGDMPANRMFETFGPQRDSINADYIWRISDTTAFLSDMNYDLSSNEIEQFNVGFSRLSWPKLSYYIGARYLRSTQIGGETGSNAFTFAATYKISPRYTLTFAHQFDFDYGKRIFNQISLVRRYHRVYYGLTYNVDESLDRQAIVFSIWPEGVGELSMGSGDSTGLESPMGRNY